MSLIQWKTRVGETDLNGFQVGMFCGVDICSVVCRDGDWSLLQFENFPGGHWQGDHPVPCCSQLDAQTIAESGLEEFLEEISLVPKSELDYANESYKTLHERHLERLVQALELAKTAARLERERDEAEARYEALRARHAEERASLMDVLTDLRAFFVMEAGKADSPLDIAFIEVIRGKLSALAGGSAE